MPFAHEAVAALGGVTGDDAADKDLIRAMCTRRFAYCLASAESASDFVAVDPLTGTIPLNLIQNSTIYAFDELDTMTAASATCLVTNDGKRYKTETIAAPWSVLTKSTVAQPLTPVTGQRFLIPAAATGTDWAGKDGKIGIYLASGWHFAIVPIGRFLYVEDETAFYHRNTSGVWTAGIGSIALGAGSVTLPMVLGANASFVIKVENQTTNAQPASPVSPTAYIIGPSPTGAVWSGNAGKLSICLVDGTWTIITPTVGDVVYDKSLLASYEYTGTAWQSAQGAWRFFTRTALQTSGSMTQSATVGAYTYSDSVAPTLSQYFTKDDAAVITRSAKRVGAIMMFTYQASWNAVANSTPVVGLFRDAETSAIAWARTDNSGSGASGCNVDFHLTSADVTSHTYKIYVFEITSHSTNYTRRTLSYQEGF